MDGAEVRSHGDPTADGAAALCESGGCAGVQGGSAGTDPGKGTRDARYRDVVDSDSVADRSADASGKRSEAGAEGRNAPDTEGDGRYGSADCGRSGSRSFGIVSSTDWI